jgi:hypothetical protein
MSHSDVISHVVDPVLQPLSPADARRLARGIVEHGVVEFSRHAEEEMAKDDMDSADCVNLIRAGVYQPPEFENGEWRYRSETRRMCVVITFLSTSHLFVVTAWRFGE